jgi:hypothetical protein
MVLMDDGLSPASDALSRRAMVRCMGVSAALATAALGVASAGTAVAGAAPLRRALSTPTGMELRPKSAVESILAALDRFPVVALGERHLLQEMHDVYTALLLHPALPGKITDFVVEFGNALYQDLADRFILGDQPVSTAELAQLWRFTIGGNVLWDAPVYERFYRTVRAVNWSLPPARRIRVLLGDPPFDHRKARGAADKAYVLDAQRQRDAHYAAVVEREVLSKGGRALLIAGANHLLRGLRSGDDPEGVNAATVLAQRFPGQVYTIDLLVLPPGPQQDPLLQRARAAVAGWPRPAVAVLAGTWLGALTQSVEPWLNSAAYLASTPAAVRYGAQADAVLYLGPGEVLTASQADPALYRWGAYPAELQRISRVAAQISGQPIDLVAEGLRRAQQGPSWFAQYARTK